MPMLRKVTTLPTLLVASVFGLALASGLSGCSRSLNSQIDLLGVDPLPAISGDAGSVERTERAPMQTLSRDDWTQVTVRVPTHQTEHAPTYVRTQYAGPSTPRRAGDYPTANTALDTPPDLNGSGYGEFFLGVGDTVWAIVSWPVKVFLPNNQPSSVRRGPDEPNEWLPPAVIRPGAIVTDPAPPSAIESPADSPPESADGM